MNRSFLSKIPWAKIMPFLIILAPFFFFVIGLRSPGIASDAYGYDQYAQHLVSGHGYTMGGVPFDPLREPGYPFFVAIIYVLFGIGNYQSVYVIQTLLLGFLGLLVYWIFVRHGQRNLGYIAGFTTGLLPAYGLYSHTLGTELLFAFLVGAAFYLMQRILGDLDDVPYTRYALLGLVCGAACLVRLQFIFFLPLAVLWYVIAYRRKVKQTVKKSALTCLVFVAVIGVWVGFVHAHTGRYAITYGRQGLSMFVRADRAQLSYRDLSKYAVLWFERSLSGGQFGDFLYNHEYQKLNHDYGTLASTSAAMAVIDKQSLATIEANPGHFLYGNLIEMIKTVYIEHDYSDIISRNVRIGMYAIVYGLCLFGLVMLWRTRKDVAYHSMHRLVLLSLAFIAYNVLVLSFFDSIPRYNTPFLTFYLIIGFAGIAIYVKNKRRKISK
jgi:4-amino-4-deoxy-L-arabinose transferase-like glycosyltransferase